MADEHTTAPGGERRQHARGSGGAWKTAITHIEQNRILNFKSVRRLSDGWKWPSW